MPPVSSRVAARHDRTHLQLVSGALVAAAAATAAAAAASGSSSRTLRLALIPKVDLQSMVWLLLRRRRL